VRVHVVVVGAGVAGVTCAEALRAAGHDGPITLVGAEPHAPYARPPLSKQVLDGSWDPSRSVLRTVAELDGLDVTLRAGATATALDPEAHVVTVDGARLHYDALVIATGVEPVRPELPGIEHAFVLRTLDDAVALRSAWACAERVVVMGTGVLGSEITSAARHHGHDVALVGRSGRLSFGTVGTLLSERLTELHRDNGVDLRPGAGALGVTIDGLVLGDGSVLAADLVVAATGGRPRTLWLAASGLTVRDGVCCDDHGRAAPDVYAIGDVARWTDPVTGRSTRIEHQTNAIEQALSVAATITGAEPLAAPIPFFWSEVHGIRIQAVGTFDPARPLDPWQEDSDVLVQRDGAVATGVVGWGAPRAFRRARAELARPVPAHA